MPDSLKPEYLADVDERNADPRVFETSAYEAERYVDTLQVLPRARDDRP